MRFNLPTYSADDFAARQIDLFPQNWIDDSEKIPLGIKYENFAAIGANFEYNETILEYTLNSTRLKLATGEALDRAVFDYFGSDLLRATGEDDDSFRARAIGALFFAGVTIPNIKASLEKALGTSARVMESFNPTDCGCFDAAYFDTATNSWKNGNIGNTYWDVDTPENPSRWADPSLRGVIFIEAEFPNYAGDGENYPVWGLDVGGAWDDPTNAWFQPRKTWFLTEKNIDQLVNRARAAGITAYRKYRGLTLKTGTESISLTVTSTNPHPIYQIFPNIVGLYSILACPWWNTRYSAQPIDQTQFKVIFNNQPDVQELVDLAVSPITEPGTGLVPITYGVDAVSLGVPSLFQGGVVIASTNYGSTCYLKSNNNSIAVIGLSDNADYGDQLNYRFFSIANSYAFDVDENATEYFASLSNSNTFRCFAMCNWNADPYIKAKTLNSVRFGFSSPAPAGGKIYIGLIQDNV